MNARQCVCTMNPRVQHVNVYDDSRTEYFALFLSFASFLSFVFTPFASPRVLVLLPLYAREPSLFILVRCARARQSTLDLEEANRVPKFFASGLMKLYGRRDRVVSFSIVHGRRLAVESARRSVLTGP